MYKNNPSVEYEELRVEYNKESFRESLDNAKDQRCCNCGSTKNLEYHHIVPLLLGGTNELSNIVCICNRCHKSAHNGRHIRDYCNKKISGRPRKSLGEEKAKAFDLYFSGKIGTAELKAICGYSSKSHITDTAEYKDYKKEHGIEIFRNNRDLALCDHTKDRSKICIAYTKYVDGKEEKIFLP